MDTSKKPPKSDKIITLNEWVYLHPPSLIKGKFYVINAPWGFLTIWNVIKRWLDPVTVDKITILGSSYQPVLLAQIPEENLPAQFGGTCRCPGGCELSDAGPWQDSQWLDPKAARAGASKQVIKDDAAAISEMGERSVSHTLAPGASVETPPDKTTIHIA